jgi:hypothetical protein
LVASKPAVTAPASREPVARCSSTAAAYADTPMLTTENAIADAPVR